VKNIIVPMSYNQTLATRVRERIADLPNMLEKEMMGGLVFMYNDKMCLGIIKDELMCRIDPAIHDIQVEKYWCRTMDFTKRPMKGYILVEEAGMRTKKEFDYWIDLALDFNSRAKASKKRQSK
jgi:TfoX/Sxy family transcriptional regulator of competence genes